MRGSSSEVGRAAFDEVRGARVIVSLCWIVPGDVYLSRLLHLLLNVSGDSLNHRCIFADI